MFKFFLLSVLVFSWSSDRKTYPEIWWKEIPKSEAQWWEILPQEARDGEVILSKRNELGILSNFAATPFTYHGKKYASVEGFWQMTKYPEGKDDIRSHNPKIKWKYTRDEVANLTSFEAKKAGSLAEDNMKELKINWVTFENEKLTYRENKKGKFYDLIYAVLVEKITQNSSVKDLLLKTGDLKLLPDHHQEKDSPPAWRYFDIYMELRKKLQSSPTHTL